MNYERTASSLALHMAQSQPWAIRPETLEQIMAIAERRNSGDIQAVQQQLGRPLSNTQRTTIRSTDNGQIAVVPVSGPIFRHANLFTEISGATSIDMLATDLRTSLDSPEIAGIVLEVDSPGGTVAGVQEFAQQVYEARGRKPIVAYVDDTAASAAYWIASAADRVVMAGSAEAGSVGVVVSAIKNDRADEREFVSSQSPNKRPDPDTDAGAQEIQRRVDDLAEVFVADVAAFRDVSVQTVLESFGQGSLLIASKAVAAGMADEITTFEKLLPTVAARPVQKGTQPQTQSSEGAQTMSEQPQTKATSTDRVSGKPSTDEQLKKEYASSADLQAEFASAETYIAYVKANRSGRVHTTTPKATSQAKR